MTKPPPAQARTLVVSPSLFVPSGSQPWRDALVLTPNREAARTLRVPSRTVEEQAARILQDAGLRIASPLLARRALRSAVERSGGVTDPSGFAAVADGTLRELMRAGVDVRALQNDGHPRIRRLGAVADAMREILRAAGFVAPADVLRKAAELCGAGTGRARRVAVVGFPRLPVAERAFLDAFSAPGSVAFLPSADVAMFRENEAAVEDFRGRGWRIEWRESPREGVGPELAGSWLTRERNAAARGGVQDATVARPRVDEAHQTPSADPGNHPGAVAHAYADLDAEVRGTLLAVKRLLLAGTPADAIAVVARHERSYGPSLLAVADEYRIPFRVLYSVPVLETRVGAWLEAGLTAMADAYPFEATARWLADPLAGAPGADIWDLARETRPEGAKAWRELGVDLPAAWPERDRRRRFLELLDGLLARFDVARNAARWSREANALQALANALQELPDPDAEISFEAFRAELSELAALVQVDASPGAGGVELHTPLSMFGARFAHVFVVGAAEGSLPDPVRPDPLLDPFERARLREDHPWLEDVRAAARREEISFWAALHSADERLVMSFPKLSGRSEVLPSPYLDRLGIHVRDAPPSAIGSQRELRRIRLADRTSPEGDPVHERARRAWVVELGRESDAPWDAFDGVTGIPYSVPRDGVGVTRLIDMASCPFKFWARSVLYLRELSEAPTTLDPALRGSLYHEVLHRAVDAARGSHDLRSVALANLEHAFAEAEVEIEASRGVRVSAFPNWERDRVDHLRVLRRAIRSEAFVREGARVLALERRFRGTWRGIPVRGQIDRIDRHEDGITLIDYKSGGSVANLAKDESGKAALDLQLPAYREGSVEVLAELAPDAADSLPGTRYYSVTKAEEITAREPDDAEQERIARDVVRGWASGSFPVDPDQGWSACTYCPYDAVCRKGPRLERKRRRG